LSQQEKKCVERINDNPDPNCHLVLRTLKIQYRMQHLKKIL
jgi:hypothetical protein